jgi:hypothetical protein
MEQVSPKTQLWYAGKRLCCAGLPDWQDIYQSDRHRSILDTMAINPRTKSVLTTYSGPQEEVRLREQDTCSHPGKIIRDQEVIKNTAQLYGGSFTALCLTMDHQWMYACSAEGTIYKIHLRTNRLSKIINRIIGCPHGLSECRGALMTLDGKALITQDNGYLSRMELSNHRFTRTG